MSNNITVEVFPVRNPSTSRVKAMAQVTVKGIKIGSCRLVEGQNGIFLSLPQEKGRGEKANQYFPLVTLEREDFDAANKLAVTKFNELVGA